MAKLKVSDRDLKRANRAAQPQKKGIGIGGVIAWILTIACCTALTFLILGHKKKQALAQATYDQQFTELKATLDKTHEEALRKSEELEAQVSQLKASEEENAEAKKLAKEVDKAEASLKRINEQLANYERQFATARETYGFPHQNMQELIDDYKKIAALAERAAAIAEAAQPVDVTALVATNLPTREVKEEKPERPKPESRSIDLIREITKFRSKSLVSCYLAVKNGDFNENYTLKTTTIIYGVDVDNSHVYRVLKRMDQEIEVPKRATKVIFDGKVPIKMYIPFEGTWEYENVAVLIHDHDGDLVKAMEKKTGEIKEPNKFMALKLGDHFDRDIEKIMKVRN